jgi:hypothetical protein
MLYYTRHFLNPTILQKFQHCKTLMLRASSNTGRRISNISLMEQHLFLIRYLNILQFFLTLHITLNKNFVLGFIKVAFSSCKWTQNVLFVTRPRLVLVCWCLVAHSGRKAQIAWRSGIGTGKHWASWLQEKGSPHLQRKLWSKKGAK